MGVKEVRPGEVNQENIVGKKSTRDIGSVGLDELVKKVESKLAEKVEKVTAEKGSAVESKEPQLKQAYFNKVGIEKNLDTNATRALRGNLGGGGVQDARNLKLVVLPKLEKKADPVEIGSFGSKANIQAPFSFELGDLLARTLGEVQAKPNRYTKRMDKLKEKADARKAKFGDRKIQENPDRDANEELEEEYRKQKRQQSVVKMFEHMNKALGQKMDMTGAPPPPAVKKIDDDDDDE